MKTSHFPSIPFLASRHPTMVRWRVRRVSIRILETPCHRSDSQSRNSNDPFPELTLQEWLTPAGAVVSTLSFSGIFTHRIASTSMGAPFPLLDLSLSVMVTTTSAQHKRFARWVPQLGSEFVSMPFIALWRMIKVHIINSERMKM